ncbi:MAG: hypothetical protein P8080_00755 [Gammaproteobacteria bacterium]
MAGDGKQDPARRARVIRTAIILALAAAAVYVAFFLVMAERSKGIS